MSVPYQVSAKMRDTIKKIVATEVRRLNPPPRVGAVQHIDRLNGTIRVLFPGDATPLMVKMTPGAQPQNAAYDDGTGNAPADLVRIGGRPGGYYLMDVITSSARNLMYDERIEKVETEVNTDELAPQASPEPQVYSAIGAAVVDFEPLLIGDRSPIANPDPTKYELHASPVDTVEPSEGTLVSVDAITPVWVRRMPGTDTALPYDSDTYFCLIAYDKDGPAPRSPWVAGKPKQATDTDVLLSVETLLANNALVEALKAVDVSVSGDLTANTLTGTGKASFRTEVELGPGAKLKMQKATTAPTTPPTPTQSVPFTSVTPRAWGAGGYYKNGYFYTCHTDGTIYRQQDAADSVAELVIDLKTQMGVIPVSVCELDNGNRVVYGFAAGGPFAGTYPFQLFDPNWNPIGNLFWPPTGGSAVIAADGNNIVRVRKNSNNAYVFETWNPASPGTGGPGGTSNPASTVTSTYTNASGTIRSLLVTTADLGAKTYLVGNSEAVFRAFTTNGVRQSGLEWEAPVGEVCAFGWDGTRFLHLTQTNGKVYRYDTQTWTATASSTAWVAGTWYQDGVGPYETDLGKEVSYTRKKRWVQKYTFTDIPGAANKVRVYVGIGATKPARTSFFRVGESTTKTWEGSVPATPSGSNPPESSNFPGATASAVESADGTNYFNADGDLKLGPAAIRKWNRKTQSVSFDANGDGWISHGLGEIPSYFGAQVSSHDGQMNTLHWVKDDWTSTQVKVKLRGPSGAITGVNRDVSWEASV